MITENVYLFDHIELRGSITISSQRYKL